MSVVYVPPESGYSRECHQNGWAAPGPQAGFYCKKMKEHPLV